MAAKLHVPDFEDILPQINMDAVAEAILRPKREGDPAPYYRPDDFLNIKEMILLAAERWLPRDLIEFQFTGIEELHLHEFGGDKVKAYIDLNASVRGISKPYDAYKGKRIVIDWKTREGELDTRWKMRHIDGWQWRIYAAMTGASLVLFRGVSRRTESEYPTKDILIAVPESNYDEVEEYVWGQNRQRNALIDHGLVIWPRHMPDSCNMFGRECPFKGDCDNYTMPLYVPKPDKVMSYTALHEFSICPERHRRLLEDREADAGEESNIGDGFHKGIAELYSQATGVKL